MPTRTILGLIASVLFLPLSIALVGAEPEIQTTPTVDAQPRTATPSPDLPMAMTGTGVVYLTIANEGEQSDELVGATTDRASAAEVHEMMVEDEVGHMMPVDGPVVIPAGETVTLEPGGLHLMLIGLTDDIRLGDTFEVTLTFADAGEVTVPVTAVLDAEDAESERIEVGDLAITEVWSRPAPKIDGISGTPPATPAS